MSTDNNSITTKFTWYPTQYKNSNGSYLGNFWVNTFGKIMPSGFDQVDFELTNLVKQIRNIVHTEQNQVQEDPNKITPSFSTEVKSNVTKYNKIGGAKKSKPRVRKTRRRKV
jgi:hypothetical protein